MKKQKNRQRNSFLIFALLACTVFAFPVFSQKKIVKVDYSKRSNILNPDTLSNKYQKMVFKHFIKHSNEDLNKMEIADIKRELLSIGIPKDKKSFGAAASFFLITLKNHKKSCEQFAEFNDLAP
jgi:hypothetical protein